MTQNSIFNSSFLKKLPNFSLVAVIALSFVALTACEKDIENRGYMTKFSDFSQIQPNISTKQDVMQALGSPTTKSVFAPETWYYLGKEQTKETFFDPEIRSFSGYKITFNEAGTVSNIEMQDKSANRSFDVSEEVTETSGNEITFFQQIFGNLGKFNPASKQGGVRQGQNLPRGY